MEDQRKELTIAEIQQELQKTNELLSKTIAGYEEMNRKFQKFVSSDPELERAYKKFIQKKQRKGLSKEKSPKKQEEREAPSKTAVSRGR